MLEKYKYTGKHRRDKELPFVLPGAAYSAVENGGVSPAEIDDTEPILNRPLSTSERIDLAPSPSIAFKEVIADTNGDPAQTIKNIDLALKHFSADEFTDEEKALLSSIVVESSEEIIHKSAQKLPANDFTDPIILGSAVDVLHELEGDTEDTEPILEGIVTVVESISDASKNADHIAKLNPEEAAAFLKSVEEFKHFPAHHHEKLMELFNDSLQRITETQVTYHELQREHLKKKPQPIEEIRRSVDKYHDRKMRRRRAVGAAASNLDATAAQPVIHEKNAA